nr:protein ALP1-like [Parasteatoda tepidariorum]
MQQNILNISARFPGSSHDSYVWKSSELPNCCLLFIRIGDSGYPLEPWLLTPISGDNFSSSEEEYNRRHVSFRDTVKQCNGTLKSRFRCLLNMGASLPSTGRISVFRKCPRTEVRRKQN